MKPCEKHAYALLRMVAGFTFLWHGSQKLLNLPASGHVPATYLKFIAGPIELFGGLLIMFGFATSWAAFLACGLMAVAYWKAHGTNAVLPLLNRGELAALYCFIFLYISARGAGIWSIDSLIDRVRRKRQISG